MNVLLDSTVLIDALRRRPACLRVLEGLVTSRAKISTSAINVGEIYAGMRPHEEERVQHLISSIDVWPVTVSIAVRAGTLKSNAARKGRTLHLDDLIVAATALEHVLTVWTDNEKDFAVPGIVLYKPS